MHARALGSRRLSWADIAVLITVTIWGVNFVVVKATLNAIEPLVFNALRFTLATVIETITFVLMGHNLSIPKRDWRRVLPIALIGVTSFQVLYVYGIRYTSAGSSSVLLATVPIMVALYAGLSKKERLSLPIWLGAVLSFAGILLLTLASGQTLSASLTSLPGNIMILLAAVCWATYIIGSESIMRVYSPMKLTVLSMWIAVPLLDIIAIPGLIATDWAKIPPAAWGGVFFSGSLSLALSYVLWNTGVQRLGDTRAAVYSNLTPIVSLVAAWIVLDERLTPLQLIGAVIVLSGIWLARFGQGIPAKATKKEWVS